MKMDKFWVGIFSLFYREFMRCFRIPMQSFFAPVISTSLYLVIFGLGVGSYIPVEQNISYVQFLVPGLIMLACINNAYMDPSFSLMLRRIWGDLEDLKTSPLLPIQIVIGLACNALFRGASVSLLVYGISQLIGFYSGQSMLIPVHPVLAITFLALASLSFGFIGIGAGLYSKNFESLNIIQQFVVVPLIYLGGVFFSIDHLGSFWRVLSKYNPLFYLINGLRYCFFGIADTQVYASFLVAFSFFLITFSFAYIAAKKVSYRRY